jgi:hypothetical protein
LFQVERRAVVADAKGEETVVGGLPREVLEDFLRAAAEQGIAAQRVRTQPVAGGLAGGKDFPADGGIDGRVVVGEERDEGGAFAVGESGGCGWRAHDSSKAPPGIFFNRNLSRKNFLQSRNGLLLFARR